MTKRAIFSSASEDWGTPPEEFEKWNSIYDFVLDAAASDSNALCPKYFTKDQNALEQAWAPYKRVWLNPPYGKNIELWVRKAYEESQKGCLVVCLLPARTGRKWWHKWVLNKAHIDYHEGHLHFVKLQDGPPRTVGPAPMPTAIVTYAPKTSLLYDSHGRCAQLEAKCMGGRPGKRQFQFRIGV